MFHYFSNFFLLSYETFLLFLHLRMKQPAHVLVVIAPRKCLKKFFRKTLRGMENVTYLCNVNQKRIGYPGRIPRGQDFIDTTQFKRSLKRGFFC